MTADNRTSVSSFFTPQLLKRMLIGAGIALVPIVLLLSSVDHPDPAWPRYWMVRPLIIVPLSGAGGGAFFHLVNPMRFPGWKKLGAIFLCVLVFIIGLWMGTVLGLDGTLWD